MESIMSDTENVKKDLKQNLEEDSILKYSPEGQAFEYLNSEEGKSAVKRCREIFKKVKEGS